MFHGKFALMTGQDPRITAIADRIRELRIEKGYVSYEYFAWEHQIPRAQYWRMEKGSNFTIKSLLRVIDAHGLTMEAFFKGVDISE